MAPSAFIIGVLVFNSIVLVCFIGAIELSILARHYETEIAVVDIQTGRVDKFGE